MELDSHHPSPAKTQPALLSVSSLNQLEQTSLLTMWCRTRFFREYLHEPDLKAERALRHIECDFAAIGAALGSFGPLHLGNRAWQVDRLAKKFIAQNPEGTIVNIGCGLETFFHRLPRHAGPSISLDQKNIVSWRRRLGLDAGRSEIMVGDLVLPQTWLNTIDSSQGLLCVLAGVSMYLDQKTMHGLLCAIYAAHPRAQVIFDAHSSLGIFCSNLSIRQGGLETVRFAWSLNSPRALHRLLPTVKVAGVYELCSFRFSKLALSTRWLAAFARLIRFSKLYHLMPSGPHA